jgi:hypothetical protein
VSGLFGRASISARTSSLVISNFLRAAARTHPSKKCFHFFVRLLHPLGNLVLHGGGTCLGEVQGVVRSGQGLAGQGFPPALWRFPWHAAQSHKTLVSTSDPPAPTP